MATRTRGFDETIQWITRDVMREENTLAGRALRAGAQVIYREIRRQATIDPRRRTHNLYNAIHVSGVRESMRNDNQRYIKMGTREYANTFAPHAHLVEYGHGGRAPAPPHPFVQPSFDRRVNDAFAAMARVMRENR